MKRLAIVISVLGLAACPAIMTGCDREVSHTKSVDVKDDGSVKTKEKTVTQNPDGTVTETKEESQTKPPTRP